MSLRQTHTYADLSVSRAAYDEIRGKLQEAGYEHLLEDDRTLMQGVALVPVDEPQPEPWTATHPRKRARNGRGNKQ